MSCEIIFVHKEGAVDYAAMLEEQRGRCEAVRLGDVPDTVYLLEHAPVITLGRNAQAENLLYPEEYYAREGITLLQADRGGDVTYHGPGQLVAYPILDLTHWRRSVGWYLRKLEQILIDLLATYDLKGERLEGFTGVWVDDAKVAAIGVGLRRWVTFHGIALNVDPNMEHFRSIIPCGLVGKRVTSLRELLGETPTVQEVSQRFEACFRAQFSLKDDLGNS